MKKIDDWEALLKNKEKYESGLPIPGCYISGKIDGVTTMVETSYIDLSSLTAMDTSNEYYQLGNAKRSYLELLAGYIEYSKQNENTIYKEER